MGTLTRDTSRLKVTHSVLVSRFGSSNHASGCTLSIHLVLQEVCECPLYQTVINLEQTTRMAQSLTLRWSFRKFQFVQAQFLSIINPFILIVRAVWKIKSCLFSDIVCKKSWKEMVSPGLSQERVAVLTCRISRLHLWLANMITGRNRFKEYNLDRSESVDQVAGCYWSELPSSTRSTVSC